MTFTDPIVADEDLVRTGIRSPNYVAGSDGWRIDRLGTAEFNDVTIRGSVSSSAGDFILDDTGIWAIDPTSGAYAHIDVGSGYAFLDLYPGDWTGHTIVPGSILADMDTGTEDTGIYITASTIDGSPAARFSIYSDALYSERYSYAETDWSFFEGTIDVGGDLWVSGDCHLAGDNLSAGSFVDSLPDPPTPGYGNGANTITAAAWADLPTNTVSASVANPSGTRTMIVEVRFSAWVLASTGTVYAGIASNGGDIAITPAPGEPGVLGWGQNLLGSTGTNGSQCHGWFTVEVPAGDTLAVKMQAYRVSGTACAVNYPVIEIIPLRYT